MFLSVLVFIAVVTIVFGAYWAIIVRPEQASESALQRRLQGTASSSTSKPILVKELERLSSMPAFNALLSRHGDVVKPLHKLIEQSGTKTTVGVVVLSCAVLATAGLVAGQMAFGALWAGLVLAALLAWVPIVALQWKRDRRTLKFEELFPEAIDLLSRALRAGHAFTTALGMVAEELPQPIAGEFRLLYDRQNYGLPLDEALRDFGERVPLLDARFFVTAVLTQRESGGNLSEVLDNLAGVIRDRFTVKRQVQVKSAHGRMTGWILAAMPPALVLILLIISPGYLTPLIEEPAGIRMVMVGVGLQIIGTFIIRRIVRIDY